MHMSTANDDTHPLKVAADEHGFVPPTKQVSADFRQLLTWASAPRSARCPKEYLLRVVREWSHTLDTTDLHG